MLAIFKKELKSYLTTSSVFTALAIIFLFQMVSLFDRGLGWFEHMKLPLGVSIIGCGVGLVSKEFRSKTHKLLFSAPVGTTSIVLGKYFALVVNFFIVAVASTLICLFLRLALGAVFTASEIVFGFVGLIFLIMFFSAVVIFISTWGSNVGILASIAYAGYFATQLGDFYMSSRDTTGFWISLYSVFMQFSKPFYKLMFGVVGLETVIYFVSMIAGLLFLSKKFLESKRFV